MITANNEEELDWMGQDCLFCGRRPPVRGKSSFVKLKKLTDGPGNTLRTLRSTVAVPRCAECAEGHRKAAGKAVNIIFVGMLAVFLIVVVWNPFEIPGWAKALLVLAGALPGASMLGGTTGLPLGQRPESAGESHVAVTRLQRDGWTKDDQP